MRKLVPQWPGVNCRRNEITPAGAGGLQTHFESRHPGSIGAGAVSVLERGRANRRPTKNAACATSSLPAVKSNPGEIQSIAKLTVGELIVELTDDARRYVQDEHELYEVVAYLVERRLKRRRRSDAFLAMVQGHASAGGSRAPRLRRRGRLRFSR